MRRRLFIGVSGSLVISASKQGFRPIASARRGGYLAWCDHPLGPVLTPPLRIVLQAAAGFTALRLEQVADHEPEENARVHLTPRELAVLRLVSLGRNTEDTAKLLGLGEETVRSHLKNAQGKLGALNRTHAAAEAIRQQLIP